MKFPTLKNDKLFSVDMLTNYRNSGIRRVLAQFLVVVLIFSALAMGLLAVYRENLKAVTKHETEKYLYETASSTADYLFLTFQENRKIIRALSFSLTEGKYEDIEEVMNSLQEHILIYSFSNAGLLDTSGNWHMAQADVFTPAFPQHSSEEYQNNNTITMEIQNENGQHDLVLMMPLGTLGIGKLQFTTLCIVMPLPDLARNLHFSFFNETGYANILNVDGSIVYSGSSTSFAQGDNFLFALQNNELKQTNIEEIQRNMKFGKSGVFQAVNGEEDNMIYYYPMEWNDWYLFVVVPTSSLETRNAELMSVLLKASIGVGLSFFFMTLIALAVLEAINLKNRKLLEEDTNSLRLREELYRLAVANSTKYIMRLDVRNRELSIEGEAFYGAKSGMIVENIPESVSSWDAIASESKKVVVNLFENIINGEKNGECIASAMNGLGKYSPHQISYTTIFDQNKNPIYALITYEDIDAIRRKEMAYKQWRQTLETLPPKRYRLMEHNLSNDTVDNAEGELFDVGQVKGIMEYDKKMQRFVNEYVYPEDAKLFTPIMKRKKLIEDYFEGSRILEFEFRLCQGDGEPKWTKLSMQLIEYPNSTDIKAYKMYEDIDLAKRKELVLLTESQQDPLTELFNRRALEAKIITMIEDSKKGEQHAFFLFDVDYLKAVNDQFGHTVGDSVLIAFAKKLKSVFRQADAVGRVGGDEFAVFMCNVSDQANVSKKAKMVEALLVDIDKVKQPISCSVGISIYPKDGKNFETLYRFADKALYRVKENGRKDYAFYSPDIDGE